MDVYDILNAGPNHRFMIRGRDKLPLIVSNCVQSLARDIMAVQMAEISKRHTLVNTVHDELWTLAKESEAEAALADVITCMTTPPSWCLTLPLGADGGIGDNYADSK